MTTPVTIAYPCPKCRAGQAILPSKIEAAGIVRCARCGRKHGRLDEVQRQIVSKAREEGAQRKREVYRDRPTQKYSNSAVKRPEEPAASKQGAGADG
jgi:DNA-directed RNA polymerase subunit RPC12/RpoP